MTQNASYLHRCIMSHNMSLLVTLLDHGGDVNVKNENGKTLLHFAAKDNYLAGLELLLNRGAIVNMKDKDLNTPLHLGVGSGEVVKALLDKGASPNSKNLHEETPLHLAVRKKNLFVVKLLLEAGANTDITNTNCNSPQDTLVCNSFQEIILDKGADNVELNKGQTPLHIAAQLDDVAIVQLLLEYGADPNKVELNESTFNYLAAIGKVCGRNKVQGTTALHYAVCNENQMIVRLLLDYGANPSIRDSFGEMPLHKSVQQSSGCLDIVKMIISKGADIDAQNSFGRTPLYMAASFGSKKLIKLLIALGANVNISDENGDTPLLESVLNDDFEVMTSLIKSGAIVDYENNGGATPLCWAVGLCKLNVEILLDSGASIDCAIYNKDIIEYWNNDDSIKCSLKNHLTKVQCISLIQKKMINWRDLDPFQVACLEELESMKKNNHGRHRVFDVLLNCDDPLFVTNGLLEHEIINCEDKYPIYNLILYSTFMRLKQRYKMMNKVVEYFNNDVLPVEMKRKILTYFTDEDLENVIKVVENQNQL